mgnify:CR=1 FL=1
MPKLFFYITLSLATTLCLYFVYKATDYTDQENLIKDIIPQELRFKLLNIDLPEKALIQERETIIIGTSHVQMGFDTCTSKSINKLSGNLMTGEKSINIAIALVSEMNTPHLILEVTLLNSDEKRSQKNITKAAEYVLSGAPILFEYLQRPKQRNCAPRKNRILKEDVLEVSLLASEKFDQTDINTLFVQYRKNLNKLINACDNTEESRITLVTLPIHPDLLATQNIQKTFKLLESNILNHLKNMRNDHACNIEYINLIELGYEFSEKKFWIDPGHFLPEVGDRVLEKIDLFYADKKLH